MFSLCPCWFNTIDAYFFRVRNAAIFFCLFNDTLSIPQIWHHTASNDGVIMNTELRRTWKEPVAGYSETRSRHLFEEVKKSRSAWSEWPFYRSNFEAMTSPAPTTTLRGLMLTGNIQHLMTLHITPKEEVWRRKWPSVLCGCKSYFVFERSRVWLSGRNPGSLISIPWIFCFYRKTIGTYLKICHGGFTTRT